MYTFFCGFKSVQITDHKFNEYKNKGHFSTKFIEHVNKYANHTPVSNHAIYRLYDLTNKFNKCPIHLRRAFQFFGPSAIK